MSAKASDRRSAGETARDLLRTATETASSVAASSRAWVPRSERTRLVVAAGSIGVAVGMSMAGYHRPMILLALAPAAVIGLAELDTGRRS